MYSSSFPHAQPRKKSILPSLPTLYFIFRRCLLSGWHFCQEYDRLNTQRFQEFIDALSHQLGDDIALIQLDQAGAHVTSALHWPDNLIPGKSTSP